MLFSFVQNLILLCVGEVSQRLITVSFYILLRKLRARKPYFRLIVYKILIKIVTLNYGNTKMKCI